MEQLISVVLGILGLLGLITPIILILILVSIRNVSDTVSHKDKSKDLPDRMKEPNYYFNDSNEPKE